MSDEHERALARLLATTDRPVTVVAASQAQAMAVHEEARNAVLSASELSPIPRTPASDHLGSCGHELDPWESHLEHAPDCPRVLCLEDRCDCPEVCPDCCRSCGYDTAERSGP